MGEGSLTFTSVAQGAGPVAPVTVLAVEGAHSVGADACGADSRKGTFIQVYTERQLWPWTQRGCPSNETVPHHTSHPSGSPEMASLVHTV